MIRTYDFIFTAKQDENFRKALEGALFSTEDCELCTDTHKLSFDAASQTVSVTPAPGSWLAVKIVPKRIKYQAVIKMLHDDWDHFSPDDLTDL